MHDYDNDSRYEELPAELTGSEARRFLSKDGKELVEIRGVDIITTRKDDEGRISVAWKRVTDTD